MRNLSFTACHNDLKAVADVLSQFRLRQKETLSNLRTTMKWPLQKTEITDLTQRIERYKRTIAVAVAADNLY